MESDRELLERAAKAAGIEIVGPVENFIIQFDERQKGGFIVNNDKGCSSIWNPLTNDGDALRLAVKLNMRIHIEADSAGCITVEWDFDEGGHARQSLSQDAPMGGDDYAATRRAIVRAAAAMPEGGQG